MTSNWKKRTAGILACLFIMQSLPVSALAVELTEEETQELVNLIPAEPQDAANPVETPADETSEAEQLPETDESEQPTVAIDEPESEAPGTQQPQQEVPAEMIVPAIEVVSDEQQEIAVELQNGTAVIPSDATETEVKEALYEALVANKDELGEDFDPQSLDWEYYCEGKSNGTGLVKNSAWGSIDGFTSTTGGSSFFDPEITYTHPKLVNNDDGDWKIRIAGTDTKVTLTKAAKYDSSIKLNDGDYAVGLTYSDSTTVNYDALREAIFSTVVASVEPDLNVNDVTIEYYAENVVLGRPGGTYAWMPFEGGKADVREFPPISEGTHKIKISWGGNETYYGFEEEVTVNITEREQAPYTLKETPDSVVLAVDENLKVDYDALHDAIFDAVIEFSKVLTSNNVSIEYYYEGLTALDSKWLPLEGQSVVGGLGFPAISAGERKIRISYAGDSTYAPTTIEATITVADREQVQFQLKDGSYEVGMVYDAEQGYDYVATARAIYNAVIASTTPAVKFEDVTLEFKKSQWDYYKPLDQGSLLGEFGVGTWDIRISVADTQEYRGNKVEVDVITTDNRIDSAVVLKNGASFTYNMDPTVMKQAIFENVIDWEQSELPDKNTLSLDNFVIEYKAKLTDLESGIDIDFGDIPGLDSDVLTQWVPIEGKEYSIAGTVLGGFPQMGAGENQQIRISYKGNADYKPSAETEGTVTVNKAKVSVKVNSTNIYADETLPADFITTNPADEFDIYTIYAGITSNVTTGIYLDLPERYTESAFLNILDPVVEAIYGKSFTQMMNDGVTVGELRELFNTQQLLDLLDKLNIDTGTFGEILNVINKLPSVMDSVRVSFGEPNRAGLYTVAAVTDNKNYETGVGMGFLLVKMRMSGAHLTWDEEINGGKLTAEQAKTFDFGATLSYDGDTTVDQSGVHYLYSGFTSKWRIYSSTTTPPTEPGRYVVTVCILGGNYMAAPITRSFQITK